MTTPVMVSFLADLLKECNEDLSEQEVLSELGLALQSVGYPVDALSVTAADAVSVLEWLDAGIVRTTPEQRAGLVGGFRHRNRSARSHLTSLAGTEHE